MNRRDFLKCSAAASLLTLAPPNRASAAKTNNPNIVFILADDLGYGDVRAFNPDSKIPTPGFDRIAGQGMKFTDAHSGSAVCTPTRYGFVTGRYAWRTRLKSGVLNGYSSHLIDPDRLTVAGLLKQNGYHTACIGKWHLGMDYPFKDGGSIDNERNLSHKGKPIDYSRKIKNGPQSLGFDYNYNVPASLDMPPYVYVENDRFTDTPTRIKEAVSFPGYVRQGPVADSFVFVDCLTHLTDKVVDYIKERGKVNVDGGGPFFLYFPLTAPHKPALPEERFRGKSGLGIYGDFLMQVDEVIARVDDALNDAGVADNTLLVITSDNGSYMYDLTTAAQKNILEPGKDHLDHPETQGYFPEHHRANAKWRGTKADIWEAGHRVPYIVRWPGKVRAGSECDTPICHTDFMATCAQILDAELPSNAGEDSFSSLPLMLGMKSRKPRPPVVHHSANGTFALRQGQWKLILGSGSGGRGVPQSKPWSEPYQLYDMLNDPGESTNLISDPEQAGVVRALTEWGEKLGIFDGKN